MNRAFLPIAVVFSGSTLLLIDSTIKSAVLLAVAGLVALMLRRDSAATRHLVWLVAIVAMLVVPVLSAVLPQWRVLPTWAVIGDQPGHSNGTDGINGICIGYWFTLRKIFATTNTYIVQQKCHCCTV